MKNNTNGEGNSKRGVAALVMVMLILGLLMSVSGSFSSMVQTENQVQTMSTDNSRAIDAALAGVNYAISELYKVGIFDKVEWKREYTPNWEYVWNDNGLFTVSGNDDDNVWRQIDPELGGGTEPPPGEEPSPPEDTGTDDSFYNPDAEDFTATSSYIFRISIASEKYYDIKNLDVNTNPPTATSTVPVVHVKAQGKCCFTSDDGAEITNLEVKAQILATCAVYKNERRIQMIGYEVKPWQEDKNHFFYKESYE